MNKTLIALAVSAAAVATGVNAAELYNQDGNTLTMGGRAEARLFLQDGKATDNSRVRLNFTGKAQINENLYGLGVWEGEFTTADEGSTDAEDGSDLTNRLAYAGLGGNFGEVAYGKTEGALGVITDFTDIMAYHGNSAADKLGVADRTDNMIAYKGSFQNLNVKASYRFADADEDLSGDNDADGYSVSAIAALGNTGINLGAGYASEDESNEYMVGANWTFDDLYLAGLFTDGEKQIETTKDTVDYTGYEFAAAYTIDRTVFTTTYNNAETNDETSAENIAIDATYYFKPNFRGYVSYNFNLISEGDTIGEVATANGSASKADSEDSIALGLRFDF
ncbi:outer membrane protein OmpU [Vibrio xiamenensis]|uniref:Outer membrane protein OmpU n=1 Tax=Vibrio xiamenensis TaxID=861298 RepID=A0A1G8AY58_9VIBR|nr:porin [Vibrio xiamenensis]SDH25952.1 outer membrane protein OmpU [Vibrio xiamenensis]